VSAPEGGDAATDAAALTARLDVVLAAFASGDRAAAARALLAIAAPRLASRLGDEDHLAHVLANPAWSPLLGHRSARRERVERIGDAARVRIVVDAADGTRAGYLASARRDVSEDAWRLTGLVREELTAG
jgi:hypothetical protein